MSETCQDTIPPILAGPMVRHVSTKQLVFWLVTRDATPLKLCYWHSGQEEPKASFTFPVGHSRHVPLGRHAHLHLLVVNTPEALPEDCWIDYDIGVGEQACWLTDTVPELLYPGQSRPQFMVKSRVDQLLHGSCRKPHHPDAEGLIAVDQQLAEARKPEASCDLQPALLMLSGDQIYADDVAGPMLLAIGQLIERLGLFDEPLEGLPGYPSATSLWNSPHNLYGRTELLPSNTANDTLRERFFLAAKKPIFTSANADNHLISRAELLAMYLLVWSSRPWQLVDLNSAQIPTNQQQRYAKELVAIEQFIKGLPAAQRVFGQLPSYMIFDDHDVTDDWNLTRGWEESAYGHPFSRRIIGNALYCYLLCQGWGNAPENFSGTLIEQLRSNLAAGTQAKDDAFFETLIRFDRWQYCIDTQPKLVVLDTRTRRWRSESSPARPSGLMDWEALSELQQQLVGEKAVLLVSPAPIFGVKLVEVVQRIFTWFGHALTVDAENWMAHPGAANVILNIFRSPKTPENFVILSGDVHYSFCYDVRLKRHQGSPKIWQITSSGIKGTFPAKLLKAFDLCNRALFASHSPLNWFTRRRHMRIRPRKPSTQDYRHQRLVNGNGIGRVWLDEHGEPTRIETLHANGQKISYLTRGADDWYDG